MVSTQNFWLEIPETSHFKWKGRRAMFLVPSKQSRWLIKNLSDGTRRNQHGNGMVNMEYLQRLPACSGKFPSDPHFSFPF